MSKSFSVMPITIKEANEFIRNYHRHHRPTARNNGKWALAGIMGDDIFGVAITSSPVSATYKDGFTLEVTRLCVKEDAPKGACSFLLSKCCFIWRSMGGKRVITYTLESESGASLRGAGWSRAGIVKPHKRWQRKEKQDGVKREDLPIYCVTKMRWEKNLVG